MSSFLLSKTGRCGSTIVGQIIESVQGTLLMSEPDGLTNLALMIETGELFRWLSSVIKITCKPHDLNATRICKKTQFCAMGFMEPLFR